MTEGNGIEASWVNGNHCFFIEIERMSGIVSVNFPKCKKDRSKEGAEQLPEYRTSPTFSAFFCNVLIGDFSLNRNERIP